MDVLAEIRQTENPLNSQPARTETNHFFTDHKKNPPRIRGTGMASGYLPSRVGGNVVALQFALTA